MSAVYMMLSEAWLSPGGEWVQGQGPDPTSMLHAAPRPWRKDAVFSTSGFDFWHAHMHDFRRVICSLSSNPHNQWHVLSAWIAQA